VFAAQLGYYVMSSSTYAVCLTGLSGDAVFEFSFGLVVGGALGYGLRAYISYYRRAAARRRVGAI
jgi:hypothetical protein